MLKRTFLSLALLSAAAAAPAAAQMGPTARLTVEPYAGYGFFGDLPEEAPSLEDAVAYGGRVAYQLSPQWAVFGNYQRSEPGIEDLEGVEVTVDHWAGGVEFSYVPRGGAEGMLPIVLEAGLGQARYSDLQIGNVTIEDTESDLAVKLGLSSALQLSPRFGIRYGVDDYISNFQDDGIVNQIFARVGAEISF